MTATVLLWTTVLTGAGTNQTAASTKQTHAVASVTEPLPAVQTAQQAADLGAANAGAQDVEQSIAVVDRVTGELVAVQDGDRVFNSESILKPFTAAFYLLGANGSPDPELAEELRTMIEVSDNGIQSALWDYDIIPTIAERYGLQNTSNGRNPSARTWGSDRTTAADQARFLFMMSQDPLVGPMLMPWMAASTPNGADGFNQAFGFNALTGDHGSKQGWSDPGWSPANLHSVGWTERYFAAVLQSSATATYATMRATSTHSVQLIANAGQPVVAAVDIPNGSVDRLAALIDQIEVAAVGRQIARTVRTNDVVRLFGVGRLTADVLCADNERC